MRLVMDSSALLALLRSEEGADEVELLLADNQCSVHAVNLCEAYYGFRREKGEEQAEAALDALALTGLETREDLDPAFWQLAGIYKCDHRRISLADCFGLALANRLNAEFVTTDHHEIDPLVDLGLCRVHFIR